MSPDPAAVNADVTVTTTADDSSTGGSDIAAVEYRWRLDGSGPTGWSTWTVMTASDDTFDSSVEGATATISGGFTSAGVYEICVQATDAATNTSDGTACSFVAVYDPSVGFTVGSGEVYSPAAADLVGGAEGPARFVFVSKYAKGKTTPDGNFQFHFKDGDLRFKSTSQAWLVVTGEPRARFQGVGLLNDTVECTYVVDAWDGSHSTGGDAFGLRIFDCGGTTSTRYDLAPQPLTRGDVKVQAK